MGEGQRGGEEGGKGEGGWSKLRENTNANTVLGDVCSEQCFQLHVYKLLPHLKRSLFRSPLVLSY